MSLGFNNICQLFKELAFPDIEQNLKRERAVQTWFYRHKLSLPDRGPTRLALLSCLFLEKRPDRVYGF